MEKIRLLLVDDHPVVRAGLRALLDRETDIEVVGEAMDGATGVQSALALCPDVVVMDIAMGAVNGFEATRQIREQLPDTRVLVLTMHEDGEYLRQAIQAGATGFVVKKAAGVELAVAIRAVRRGEIFVYPTMTRVLLGDMAPHQEQPPAERRDALDLLSSREKEVLRLVAQGCTSRQIAQSLFISVRTVETYRARLMEKLELKTRVALVRFALQHGLLNDVIQQPGAPEI